MAQKPAFNNSQSKSALGFKRECSDVFKGYGEIFINDFIMNLPLNLTTTEFVQKIDENLTKLPVTVQ